MTDGKSRANSHKLMQLGLLAGIGLGFAVGGREQPAEAGGGCLQEGQCSVKKPNIMIIVDYSTSMNQIWENNQSRWQITVDALQQLVAPGSFLSQSTHLALLHYGHDPLPGSAGTPIAGDTSGLVDGVALDVAWDDDADLYLDCNGQAVVDALQQLPAPLAGAMVGIQSWTKGALDRAALEITATKADHPEDGGERAYANILLTDGPWTGVDGTTISSPASQNPGLTAASLFDNQSIPTYVVTIAGDAQTQTAGDALATAGGTTAAVHASTGAELEQGLAQVLDAMQAQVIVPSCAGGIPRVMVLLDASSSMLNVNGGTMAGGMGETGWDQARESLAGDPSMMTVDVDTDVTAEDVALFGLAVFGHTGEQEILFQYGPCARENFYWALDPAVSCEQPGCDDPWGGPPIQWTFKDGNIEDPPAFDQQTLSHMPRCDGASFCAGSGTYTNLGLQRIKDNQVQYHLAAQQPDASYPANDATTYVNILLTDGQYTGYATNAQVQAEFEAMFNAGIVTWVIGFGDGLATPQAIAQLESMADWGSGGANDYLDANNQAELEAALTQIVSNLDYDPCCVVEDCGNSPTPTGADEPDPLPPVDTTDTGTDTGTDSTGTDSTDSTGTDSTDTDSTSTDSTGTDSSSSGGTIGDEIGSDETGGSLDGLGGDDDCNCRSDGRGRGAPLGLLGLLGLLGFGLGRRRRAGERSSIRDGSTA